MAGNPFDSAGDARPFVESQWTQWLEKIREAVSQIGPKECAYSLDMAPSQLSNSLAERDRHRLPAKALVYIAARAPSDEVAAFLPHLRGLEVTEARPLTPEERLARMEAALAELGGPLRDWVIERAFPERKRR